MPIRTLSQNSVGRCSPVTGLARISLPLEQVEIGGMGNKSPCRSGPLALKRLAPRLHDKPRK